MTTQNEMEEIFTKHQINLKLGSMIGGQGASGLIANGRLSDILNTLNDDGTLKDRFQQENVYNYNQLKEDAKVLLTNYTHEVGKNRELMQTINLNESRRAMYEEKISKINSIAGYFDKVITETKDKLKSHLEIHEKCKTTQRLKTIKKSKKEKGNIDANDELNIYQEYIEFLTQLNNKIDPLVISHPAKLKLHYKIIHNFFTSRIDFIKKRARYENENYDDHPFLLSFFYHIIKVIGAGGSYNSQKMFEYLQSLVKCQLNTKILIMCRALGLVEDNNFGIDLQRKYLTYLQLMNEIKEGLDVMVNYETCKLYVY